MAQDIYSLRVVLEDLMNLLFPQERGNLLIAEELYASQAGLCSMGRQSFMISLQNV